eukprot:363616-Chlamydomonas_euryale.AAC.5
MGSAKRHFMNRISAYMEQACTGMHALSRPSAGPEQALSRPRAGPEQALSRPRAGHDQALSRP